MTRRPKPSRSGSPGCEPTATPCSTAASTVRCIVSGSPPWKPQARLAVVIRGSSAVIRAELPVAERLADIAVDVHAHAAAGSEAISACSSRAICCASSTLTAAKRTGSIGRIWPSTPRSVEITVPIFA